MREGTVIAAFLQHYTQGQAQSSCKINIGYVNKLMNEKIQIPAY